mgnify:CR=1 FL=1
MAQLKKLPRPGDVTIARRATSTGAGSTASATMAVSELVDELSARLGTGACYSIRPRAQHSPEQAWRGPRGIPRENTPAIISDPAATSSRSAGCGLWERYRHAAGAEALFPSSASSAAAHAGPTHHTLSPLAMSFSYSRFTSAASALTRYDRNTSNFDDGAGLNTGPARPAGLAVPAGSGFEAQARPASSPPAGQLSNLLEHVFGAPGLCDFLVKPSTNGTLQA